MNRRGSFYCICSLALGLVVQGAHGQDLSISEAEYAAPANPGPDVAYRAARGEVVQSQTAVPFKLIRPLDFVVVTDHAENLGLSIYDIDLRDPDQRAFYYVRMLEIPTPRWTAYDAKYFQSDMPEGAPMEVIDRAYTSPIWYTPEA